MHDAFASKGRVAVHQDRHGFSMAIIFGAILFRATAAHGHRVNELEVARVETQRDVDFGTGRGSPVAAISQVITHVARAAMHFWLGVVELPEDTLGALAHDIGQDVQATAVSHAHHDSFDVMLTSLFQGQVEQWNEAFSAFEREGLGADEFAANEFLEDGRVGQAAIDALLDFARQFDAILAAFHAALQPIADGAIFDVHKLHTDAAAVGIAELGQDIAQGARVDILQGRAGELAIQVTGLDAVGLRIEFGRSLAVDAQWIELCHHVTAHAILANEVVDAILHAGQPHGFIANGAGDIADRFRLPRIGWRTRLLCCGAAVSENSSKYLRQPGETLPGS